MAKAILTLEDKEQISELLKQCKTYKEIATQFGVSRERIRQVARTLGLQGYGLKTRRAEKVQELHEHLTNKYGEFYSDGVIDKSDFLSICRYKFSNKRSQVIYQSPHKWEVEFKDIHWNTHCPILGIELNYFSEGRAENSPSFDRIDNSKGYVPGNVQIISWRATRLKNNGSSEEHFKIAKYLQNLGC